jgi:hypothetical protein
MKVRIFAAAAACLVASGCAKRPDAIVATDIPMAAYINMTCSGIAEAIINENGNLAALSKQQNSAANKDMLGVALIGVPASSTFGGDKEGIIANSKGKLNAMEAASKNKGCS